MTTPVQTWGALGNMVQEQKDFGAMTAEYLEKYEVYDLFGQLLRQVLVERPANPIKFLQECLKERPKLYVCVIGPPGINRSKYCQQLAADSKVKHIHVGKMLRARKDLKNTIEAGELVADDIVIDMVTDELKNVKQSGWVLDGFPRTKIQAQALEAAGKEIGTSLDTVLLLNGKEEIIRARYEEKVVAAGFSLEEKQDLISTRLQQYKRHVLTLCEVFQNVVRHVEVPADSEDDNMLYNTMKNCLHYRPYSNAPLRMLRICIIGPCASGRTTQCQEIAKTYGVVHVDLADLLRKKQEAQGLPVEEIPPEYLSDEEACALVGARLRQADCVRKGWVLDGFPKTKAQAEFLRQAHQWPSRVIRLNVSDSNVASRIANRRLDPVTGMPYYKSPNSVVIRQRLIQCEYDMPEKVAERISLYTDNVERVVDAWKYVSSQVPSDVESDQIFAGICQKINNAVPFELAQDPVNSGL